jgi:hypothetical protein
MVAHLILAIFLLLLTALCCFGAKNTGLGIYYLAKGAVIKPLEYTACLVLALIRVNYYVWMSWCLLFVLAELFLPAQQFKLALWVLFSAYGWLLVMLVYRNICDEMLRDDVRVAFARIERKLCFNNQKLTLYPDEWSDWT